MSAEPIPVALLGAGNFAKGWHLPALAATSTMVLRAVYSRSESSASSLAAATKEYPTTSHPISVYYDSPTAPSTSLDALLSNQEIKAVILSLPIPIQPSVIERAWKAGKHVVSEKPVAKDLETAKGLIELYEREYKPKGIMWIVAEQFPYEPCFGEAKKLLDEGKIGELRGFELNYNQMMAAGNASFETAWRKTPSYQGGFLLDGGVHFLAGLRYLLPSPITSFSGYTQLIQPHLPPTDTLHAIARTVSKLQGTIKICWGVESALEQSYTFLGSKGQIVIDFGKRTTANVTASLYFNENGGKSADLVIEIKGQAVKSEFEAFGRALLAGAGSEEANEVEERSGPRATLRDLAFIEGCLKSEGKETTMSELLGEFQ